MATFKRDFDIREHGEIPEGWALATCAEARENLEAIKELLSSPEKQWFICRLADGKINGAARDYAIEEVPVKDGELGHMVISKLREFQVVANGTCPPGWKLSTCKEVKDNMDTVKGLFEGKEAQCACKIADGRVNASAGNCTVEEGGCWFGWFHRQDHMIITHDPALKSPYKVVKCGDVPQGWRLITCQEAQDNLDQIKAILGPDKSAYVCKSADGRIFGSGKDYQVEAGDHCYTLTYMIIKRIPEFKVEPNAAPSDGWRMATVKEVREDLDALKPRFRAGMEWHICQLLDGRVHGAGNEFMIEEGTTKDKLGHMVIIKEHQEEN